MGTTSLNGGRIREFLGDAIRALGIMILLALCWGSVYWLALIKRFLHGG